MIFVEKRIPVQKYEGYQLQERKEYATVQSGSLCKNGQAEIKKIETMEKT